MTTTIRIGAAQMTLHPRDEELALREAEELVLRAARADAKLICFPEHWLLSKVVERENRVYEWFAKLATETGTYINLGGIYEKQEGKTYLVSPTMGPGGEIISNQRKVHLYRQEKKQAAPGDRFETFKIEGITVGTLICHDLVFPESARTLALMGTELLLVPSLIISKGIAPWHIYLMSRSLENRVPLVSPNIFYPPRIPGKSMIIDLDYDRRSAVMQLRTRTARDGKCVVVEEIELDSKRSPRKERLSERRPGAYGT